MAAPEYVPVKPMDDVRAYESPPRRPQPWMSDRPGELNGGQPRGDRFGNQGPDQGYALSLAQHVRGTLNLEPSEHEDDAIGGCLGVALKRASVHGRAPVIHDWRLALAVWGFLDAAAPAELVALRHRLFDEVASPLHYLEKRRIVDAVREPTLRLSPMAAAEVLRRDWRSLLDLSHLGAVGQGRRDEQRATDAKADAEVDIEVDGGHRGPGTDRSRH